MTNSGWLPSRFSELYYAPETTEPASRSQSNPQACFSFDLALVAAIGEIQ
jgi:hypothetical protein